MTETADILIIGGGVMGASIAYHLSRQRAGRVIVLERRALASGTTGRSGAIVRQHYSNDFTIRMAKESLHVFEHFDELVGGNCGFVTTGMLVLGDEQGAVALKANVALQQGQGVNVQLIRPEDVREVAPGYTGEGISVACYESEAGVADPMATTQCFARRAREYGALIYEGVEVTRILTQKARVAGVETTRGSFSVPVVILAANVWSVSLAQVLGITLPITATRHPMVALRRPTEADKVNDMHAVCLDMARLVYLRPASDGITLVGSTENVFTASDPDHYHQGLTDEEIAFFHAQGQQCMPDLARAVPRGSWAGIYDDTPDYHPILGRLHAYEGLYCAAGFSGHGFKLSPTIGAWLAQLILTGQTPTDMQHFTFERFAQGKEIRPRYDSGVLG